VKNFDGDKIEENIEKMYSRRTQLWEDLCRFSNELSAVSQLALMEQMAKIDVYIKEMSAVLEDKNWHDFINSAWGNKND